MAPAAQAEQHVAGLEIKVAGAALEPRWRNSMIEMKVVDSLTLPDMALVRLKDPTGDAIDSHPLQLGKDLEIKASATGERATTSIFKGQIAAVEPEFGAQGVVISIRAYDKAHKLNRQRKTRTFQQMSASDMIRKIAGDSGLSAQVTATSVVHEFFQQSNETDWDFAWRLALMHDYEVVVDDTKLQFRPANKGDGGAPVTLTYQDTMISFRPRMSGVQQPKTVNIRAWDPKGKKVITGTSASGTTTSKAGVERSKVSNDLGGGTTAIADRVAANNGEANALAKSTLDRMSDAFYEADGVAFGNPKITAGCKVKVAGVGQQFSGTYTVTSSTHTYRGATGYQTSFQISGRSSRTLLELMRPPQERDWSASLVVGMVTNNNDPDQMGRVRVKYPSLSDTEESAWARIATPSAGNARGLLMLPQVDEEVIVGFEHGDTRRPIVVGSLFNGRDKPGADLMQNRDGSFALLSNEKIHQHSKKDFEIKSDQNMVVTIQKDETHKISGNYKNEATGNGNLKAQQYVVEAGSSMTVKGVSVTVEASASLTLKGATVDIQGSGPVNIKGAIINIG
ncbi:VgrG-related protein [Solirubrobacter ginsenosidimutans]|uniref:VgrG-related protein n=1 Tax=Solirubrobacter ginsenosidimutans TaxID=490573 RepID=A0A9X3N4X1_9ACTN|nr:VgrG-related protein [Solirubrobacter ginsenosidimutans]MDA0167306.1 VgrG-related protein [Solirubrobacter ginsenosidimutans]